MCILIHIVHLQKQRACHVYPDTHCCSSFQAKTCIVYHDTHCCSSSQAKKTAMVIKIHIVVHPL